MGVSFPHPEIMEPEGGLTQHEAKGMLRELTAVFDAMLNEAASSEISPPPNETNSAVSSRAEIKAGEVLPGCVKGSSTSSDLQLKETVSSSEKAKLERVFDLWKASKGPGCPPALPHLVTVMMYTSSLYYPLRTHSLDFCLFRCLEYSTSAQGEYLLWSKICDLLPSECSMTRSTLQLKTAGSGAGTMCRAEDGVGDSGEATAKTDHTSVLSYLYASLTQLMIANRGRFVDRRSYYDKKWWVENYKPALHAVEAALRETSEDDYALHRLLTYVHNYCQSLAIVLVSSRKGRCHLCGDYTTLTASHIVPHFFLRRVPKPICFHHNKLCSIQDDVKKYAFCGGRSGKQQSCEALFGEWETKFSLVYADLQLAGENPFSFEYKEWLPFFAYSVAWRLVLLANANASLESYQHPDWFNNVKVTLASFLSQREYAYPTEIFTLPWMFMLKYEDVPVHQGGPAINHAVHLACGGPVLEVVGDTEVIFVHLLEVIFVFPIASNPSLPMSWQPFRLSMTGVAHSVSYANLPTEVKQFLTETYAREIESSYARNQPSIKERAHASVPESAKRWLKKPPVYTIIPCTAQFDFLREHFNVFSPLRACESNAASLHCDSYNCVLQLCTEGDGERHVIMMAYIEKEEPYSTVLLALTPPPLDGGVEWCRDTLVLYPSVQVSSDCVEEEVADFLRNEFTQGSEMDKILSTWQQACTCVQKRN